MGFENKSCFQSILATTGVTLGKKKFGCQWRHLTGMPLLYTSSLPLCKATYKQFASYRLLYKSVPSTLQLSQQTVVNTVYSRSLVVRWGRAIECYCCKTVQRIGIRFHHLHSVSNQAKCRHSGKKYKLQVMQCKNVLKLSIALNNTKYFNSKHRVLAKTKQNNKMVELKSVEDCVRP